MILSPNLSLPELPIPFCVSTWEYQLGRLVTGDLVEPGEFGLGHSLVYSRRQECCLIKEWRQTLGLTKELGDEDAM